MTSWAIKNLAKHQLPPKPKEECSHMGDMTYANELCWCNRCGQKWRRYPGEGFDPDTGATDIGTGWITEQTLTAAKNKKKGRKNYDRK